MMLSRSLITLSHSGLYQSLGLGVIIPVNPHRSKEEVVFETTLEEAKSQRKPQSDLVARNCAYARPVSRSSTPI